MPSDRVLLRRRVVLPRRDRAVTLVATVVLSVLAASIGLVVVRQTLVTTRTESSRGDLDAAARAAQAARLDVESRLAGDPRFFYKTVLADPAVSERARVCVAAGGTVVQPGSAWPASCGLSWGYQQAVSAPPVRAELTPPSPADPLLHLKVLATVGQVEAGLVATYRLSSVAQWTLWSSSDLRLDDLAAGAATTTVSGAVYAGGQLDLPTAGSGVSLLDAELAAEGGFVGTPADPAQRYYTSPANLSASPPLRDIRGLAPAPLQLSALAADTARLRELACPAVAAQRLATGYATELCLAAGASLADVNGATVTVPAGTVGYLLLFGASGNAQTVDVYATTTAPAFTGDCAIRCDLSALAAKEVAAATHPGAMNFWSSSFVGTLPLPTSGVVATDADTYLGLCGSGFTSYHGSCTTWSGTGSGMLIQRDVTVVVGSAARPRDVYLSGPVLSDGSHRLGVVATGSAVVPYWSRPGGTSLELDLALAALGLGQPASGPRPSPVRTLPAVLAPALPADPNLGGTLTVHGSLAAPHLSLQLPLFAATTLAVDPGLTAAPPPWFPGFTDTWVAASESPLTPVGVCGARTCPSW